MHIDDAADLVTTDMLLLARSRPDDDAAVLMLQTFKRALEPLKKLGPQLRALLIYVAWPMCPLSDQDQRQFETDTEKEIMGQDYDSAIWASLTNVS